MFMAKFKYFFYKISYIELRHGPRADTWYQLSSI